MIIINPYQFGSAPSSLLTGLTASYSLDGNALKNVGSNDGTATNITWATGKFGQAAVFNGTSKIIIPYSSDFVLGSSNWAISIWVKRNTINSRQVIYGQSNAAGQTASICIWLEFTSTNEVVIYIVTSSFSVITLTSSSTITDSNWHNIIVQRNGATAEMFIDGSNVASDGTLSTSILNNPMRDLGIGCADGFNSLLFNGSIDELNLWNGRYLTSTEITQLQTKAYPF